MQSICTRARNHVNRPSKASSVFRRITVAVHLKFLDGDLRHRGPDVSHGSVIAEPIDRKNVSAAIATRKSEAGSGRRGNAEIRRIGQRFRFHHARCKQRQIKIVPLIHRKVLDVSRLDRIRLLHPLRLDQG